MTEEMDYSNMGIEKVGYILAGRPLPSNISQDRLFQEIADIVNIELANEGNVQISVTADEMEAVRNFYQLFQPKCYPIPVDLGKISMEEFHHKLHDPEFHFQLNTPEIDDENLRKLSNKYHNKIKYKLPPKVMDAIRNSI